MQTRHTHQCPDRCEDSPRRALCLCRRGFSLLELAILLVIMGVVLAIAMPRWQASVDRHRTELAARRVASEIDLARTRAIQQGRAWVVQAQSSSETLEIAAKGDASTASRIELGIEPLRASIGSSGFEREAGFMFDAFGVPSTDAKLRVQSGTMACLVSVRSVSGTVEVGRVYLLAAPVLLAIVDVAGDPWWTLQATGADRRSARSR